MGDVYQEGLEVRATPYTHREHAGRHSEDRLFISYSPIYVVKLRYCDRSIVLIFRLIDSVDVVPVVALWLL